MLKVNLKVQRTVDPFLLELEGKIGNISNLDAISTYAADLEDRSLAVLENYPRWSESVRGLVARCIDLSGQRLEPQSFQECRRLIELPLTGCSYHFSEGTTRQVGAELTRKYEFAFFLNGTFQHSSS